MVRKRLEPQIKSWQEADMALLAIGRLDRDIEFDEAEAQRTIEEAKERVIRQVKPLQEAKKSLELQLQAFCEAHKGEFRGKSRALNFGTVSFRQSTKLVIKGIQACIAALKSRGFLNCIRTKETLDKETMKAVLDEATLAAVGAKLVPEDVFGYEVNRERVQEAA